MAERRPSYAAGGGETSAAQVPYPPQQDYATSMMILQQQQQLQQQQRPRRQQPHIQQRATPIGRRQREKQQIRQAGPYQQYVHRMDYEASMSDLQGRPTGAGTQQQQYMQESSPGTDRLRNYNSASRSAGINPYSHVEAPRSVLDLYPTAFPSLHELSELTARWVAEHNHKERLRKNSALRYPESVGINPNFSNLAPSFLDLRHFAWSPLDTLSQMAARADELHEYERSLHPRSG